MVIILFDNKDNDIDDDDDDDVDNNDDHAGLDQQDMNSRTTDFI